MPSELNFGSVLPGDEADSAFSLVNTGETIVTIASVFLDGDTSFSLVEEQEYSIESNES